MSENSAIFETSFGSDGTKIPLGLYVLFVVLLELPAPIKNPDWMRSIKII